MNWILDRENENTRYNNRSNRDIRNELKKSTSYQCFLFHYTDKTHTVWGKLR